MHVMFCFHEDDRVTGGGCFSSFRFVCDYDELFPIADDVSLLQQAIPVMYLYELFIVLFDGANKIFCTTLLPEKLDSVRL